MARARQNDQDSRKDALLMTALKVAAQSGWSDTLLTTPAARAAYPGGAAELTAWLSHWADRQMMTALQSEDLSKLRVRDRVALGVRARLEALSPHRAATQAALRFMAAGPRGLRLPRMVWTTADLIWRAAGDTATDYNHYTKRLLLSGVITSTTLHWLNDSSPRHEKTWRFLDRRIDDVLKLGGLIGKLKKTR